MTTDRAKTGIRLQVTGMRNALLLYTKQAKKHYDTSDWTAEDWVTWFGRCHNGGKNRRNANAYTRDLWKLYRQSRAKYLEWKKIAEKGFNSALTESQS